MPCTSIRTITIIKMTILSKVIYSFKPLSKFQRHSLQKYTKNPKTHTEPQKTPKSQSNLEQKEQSWKHQIT